MTDSIGTAPLGLSEHSHGLDVPIQTRSERPRSINPNDFPELSKRQEQWRYVDLEKIAKLNQIGLSEFTGDLETNLAQGVKSRWIKTGDPLIGSAGTPEERTAAVAWDSTEGAYLIQIEKTLSTEASFLKIRSNTIEPSALHMIISAGELSKGLLVISHEGKAVISENIEIILEDGADLTLVTIQDWQDESINLLAQYAKLGRNSILKHINISLGGELVRATINTKFDRPGGQADLYGLYFADSNQYLEQRVFVDHAEPNCKSRVTYKGALQGKGAHTAWVGDVLIRAAAEGTDTYELNRNLLLTDGARADSVPNLEIETGKILGAGHASASGRFDDEHLFYLQARGITEAEARRLVVRGFLLDIVQQTGITELENELEAKLDLKLEGQGR